MLRRVFQTAACVQMASYDGSVALVFRATAKLMWEITDHKKKKMF